MMRLITAILVVASLTANAVFASQGSEPVARSAAYWFAYASKLPIGSTVRVRTADGHRDTAVLAVVDREGITVERRSRIPKPPVRIVYGNLLQLEPEQKGSGVGKAIAIGAAVGAGTFLGIMLFIAAAMD